MTVWILIEVWVSPSLINIPLCKYSYVGSNFFPYSSRQMYFCALPSLPLPYQYLLHRHPPSAHAPSLPFPVSVFLFLRPLLLESLSLLLWICFPLYPSFAFLSVCFSPSISAPECCLYQSLTYPSPLCASTLTGLETQDSSPKIILHLLLFLKINHIGLAFPKGVWGSGRWAGVYELRFTTMYTRLLKLEFACESYEPP